MVRGMTPVAKRNVAGILISPATYESAADVIMDAAHARRPFLTSALAVHGVMTGVMDREQRFRLNHFDLLVPDGQPVRWVLNLLHGAQLDDRVYGPKLTLKLCQRAAEERVPVYFYGSTEAVLAALASNLSRRFPGIEIAGAEPSKFRRLDRGEKADLIERINCSGAGLLFVGLGCPRQEVFTFELGREISMPTMAVGAAFPFIAGQLPQAPGWMQKRGLEWCYRLMTEPRRLWRRYLYLNPYYMLIIALQACGISLSPANMIAPTREELYG
jgi:N-acetylglucosaminyldiphosphoundecaprenol N-acetyl-beta-D-mannosaminyltransferase